MVLGNRSSSGDVVRGKGTTRSFLEGHTRNLFYDLKITGHGNATIVKQTKTFSYLQDHLTFEARCE